MKEPPPVKEHIKEVTIDLEDPNENVVVELKENVAEEERSECATEEDLNECATEEDLNERAAEEYNESAEEPTESAGDYQDSCVENLVESATKVNENATPQEGPSRARGLSLTVENNNILPIIVETRSASLRVKNLTRPADQTTKKKPSVNKNSKNEKHAD